MKQGLETQITAAVKALFNLEIRAELTRPDEQFGDYATNVALKLTKTLSNSPAAGPREVAEQIAAKLRETLADQVTDVAVAGPGFINLRLNDGILWQAIQAEPIKSLANQQVVVEYSDPNPFKVLHAGHVYTTVVGDAIARLLEVAGAKVHRVNFGGDVGLHVGQTMWAILHALGGEYPEKLSEISENERARWLSARYVEGHAAYQSDPEAKAEIIKHNKRVYKLHANNDRSSPFAQIYWTGREWSYEAFDAFYARLGVKLEKYYPESEVTELGMKSVREHTGSVFEESEGAVVFRGEPYGLHTRVFISSQGLPTYEAKDVGLIIKKYQDYHFDRSVVVTDNEQQQYMAVVLKAIEQFLPDLVATSTYIPHGKLKLLGGIKMSSRRGNIIPAHEVLDVTAAANKKAHGKDGEQIVLAAVKYAFSKQRIGGDIIYDPVESVSLEGNSGPYLQYAFARANSILKKSPATSHQSPVGTLEPAERSLLRKTSEYAEVVNKAVNELMPHHIATYLYELAQDFNSFYEHNRVIGDERQDLRLQLVKAYTQTLKNGLSLLNIPVPEKM